MNPEKAVTVSEYMQDPVSIQDFSKALGSEFMANQYIQSVLILVSGDDKLRECTPRSIQKAALRAASLGLSCDPATKQAWLIPYNRNVGTRDNPKWVKEAQFQPHYLGLYNLAMRTGKYWVINVSPVYEGQRVLENPMTGLHAVMDSNGFVGEPKAYNPAYVDVTTRRAKDMKIIGWIGYFKAKKGNEKSIWMSCVDIDDYARIKVKNYLDDKGRIKNENWADPEKRKTMEMKTVLRKLLAWADLSGQENAKLAEALQAENEPEHEAEAEQEPIIEATATTPEPEQPGKEPTVEMINPLDSQPVGYAANVWNNNAAQAKKDIQRAIDAGKLTNPMAKDGFKKWVANPQGEPQTA